jgi:hypothetical protein
MHVRSLIAVAAALALPTSAGAEPAKPLAAQLTRRATVQLASADQVARPAPVPATEPQPVKRPRAMRITTCRCGDSQAQPEPHR